MPPASTTRGTRPAYRSAAAVLAFVTVAGAALAADLASKHLAFSGLLADPACRAAMEDHLARDPDASAKTLLHYFHRDVMPGLRWTLSTNPGVVFGLSVSRPIVNAVTCLAIALVIGMFAASDRRAWAMHLAMAFLLAGAAGNLYDRLFSVVRLHGADLAICREVRDFIDFSQARIGGLNYPWIFNVADAWLVVGVGILMLQWVLHGLASRPRRDGAN
jgi:lipoprotein signal peptidase